MSEYGPDYRIEALDRAVRIALAFGGEQDAKTVERAEAFMAFLNAKD